MLLSVMWIVPRPGFNKQQQGEHHTATSKTEKGTDRRTLMVAKVTAVVLPLTTNCVAIDNRLLCVTTRCHCSDKNMQKCPHRRSRRLAKYGRAGCFQGNIPETKQFSVTHRHFQQTNSLSTRQVKEVRVCRLCTRKRHFLSGIDPLRDDSHYLLPPRLATWGTGTVMHNRLDITQHYL